MAKTKKDESISEEIGLQGSRLKKLIIKNFRCIGEKPVEIELDDIVVLVGANNTGKSNILKAYGIVMAHGSSEGKLELKDFPHEQIVEDKYPEIELQTWLGDEKPGPTWIHSDNGSGQEYIRERWIWTQPGDPIRQGFNAEKGDWDKKVPWGAPNVAKTNRPYPHHIDAFESPEVQANKIVKLLSELLYKRLEDIKCTDNTALNKLLSFIPEVQKEIIESTKDEIIQIEKAISDIVKGVFQGFCVKFNANPEEFNEKTINFFPNPELKMGPEGGYLSTIDKQGSGARRTLLWAALKLLVEEGKVIKTKGKKPNKETIECEVKRSNVLMIDEPEICLHPNAIREACNVLYDLASKNNDWQVMITTHSPIFIDISRDNTTIVRVEQRKDGVIFGTTIFRPDRVKLDDNEKQMLKLLNIWDPYVAEFFFGGRVILVEGDTEYSVFKNLIEDRRPEFKDVHIVRARGKAIMVPLIKILNHFKTNYSVLHDSDTMTLESGKTNPAWTLNEKIRQAVNSAPREAKIRLVASISNFERAFFKNDISKDKPYQAIQKISTDETARNEVIQLFEALLDHDKKLPKNTIEWHSINDLETEVNKY